MGSKSKCFDILVISIANTWVGKKGITIAISGLEHMNPYRIQACPLATRHQTYKSKTF